MIQANYLHKYKKPIFLAKGGFGCIIYPSLIRNKRTTAAQQPRVSKILMPKGRTFSDKQKEVKEEYQISKALRKTDPRSLYYLGPTSISTIHSHYLPETLYSQLKDRCGAKCFPNDYKDESKFLHLDIPFAYNTNVIFDAFFEDTLDVSIIMKPFAHLIRAIQLIVKQHPDIILMDVKQSNILWRIYKDRYLHPVFIDFGPHHVVSKFQTFEHYVTKWNKFDYHTWTPEVRAAMILNKNPNMQPRALTNKICRIYDKYCKLVYDDNTRKIEVLNIFRRYREKNTIVDDIYFSAEIIKNYMNKDRIPAEIREKIMIWSLANTFLRIIPKFTKNSLGAHFYQLLMYCVHPNLIKRYDCDKIMKHIDRLLHLNQSLPYKYLVKMSDKDKNILAHLHELQMDYILTKEFE